MAFEKYINDLKILFVLLIGIPLIASTNIDCGGKSFHCLNSTHFMICVDVGGGVSYTVDNVVIPCPFPTVCLRGNWFECELPTSPTAAPTTVLPVSVIKEKETTTEEVIVDTLAWNAGPEQQLELSTVATLETTTDATVIPLRPVTTSNDSISTVNTSESSTLTATEILEITTLTDQNITGTVNEISTVADKNSILTSTDTPVEPFTTSADLGHVSTILDIIFTNENVITSDTLSGNGTENFKEALTATESVINSEYDVNATEAVFVNNSDVSTNQTVQDNILLATPTSATNVSSVQDTTEASLSERLVSTTKAKVMHSNTTDDLINYETTTEPHLTIVANVKNNASEIKPKILEVMTTSVPVISTTEGESSTVNKKGNAFDLDSSSSFVNQSADPIIYRNVQNDREKSSNITLSTDDTASSSVSTNVEATIGYLIPSSSNTEMKTENKTKNSSLTYDNGTNISKTSINDGDVNYTTQDARNTIDTTTTTTQPTILTTDILLLKYNSTLDKQELVTTTPSTPVIVLTNSSARQVTEKYLNNAVQQTIEAFEETRNNNNNTNGFEVIIVENILFHGTENTGSSNISEYRNITKLSQNNVNKQIGPPLSPVLSRNYTNTLENGGTKQIINTLTNNINATNSVQRVENEENGLDANFEHNIETTTVKIKEIEPTAVLTNLDQSIATTTVQKSKPEMTGVPTNLEQSIAKTTVQNYRVESTGLNTNSNQSVDTTTLQNETAPINVLTILGQSTANTTLMNSEVEPSDGLPKPGQSFATTRVQNDRAEQTGVPSNSENVTITKVSNETEQIVVPKNFKQNVTATTSSSIIMLNNSEQVVANTTIQNGKNIQTDLANSTVQNGRVQSTDVPTISEQNVSATTTINDVSKPILFLSDSHNSVDTTTIQNYGTNNGTSVRTERIALMPSLDQSDNTDRIKNVKNMSEQSIGTSTIQKSATLLPVNTENNIVMITVQGETGQNRSQDNSVQTVATNAVLNETGQAGSQANSGQGTVTATLQHGDNGVTGSKAISGQSTVPTIAQRSERELTEAQANSAQSIVTDTLKTLESGLTGSQANSEQSTVPTTKHSGGSGQTGSQAISEQSTVTTTLQQGKSELTGSQANSVQGTVTTKVQEGENGVTGSQTNLEQGTDTATVHKDESGTTGLQANSEQGTVTTLIQQTESGLTGSQIISEQGTITTKVQQGESGHIGSQANLEHNTVTTTLQNGESGLIGSPTNFEQGTTTTVQQGKSRLTGSQANSKQDTVSIAPLTNGQSTTMNTAQTKNNVLLTNKKQIKYNINGTNILSNVLHVSNGTLALSNEDHISTILVEVVKTTISADGEFSTNAPSKLTTITYKFNGYSDGKVVSTPIVAAEASGNPDENTINLIKEITSMNNIFNSDFEKASYDNVPMVALSESSYTSTPKTILNNNANSEKNVIGLHPNLNSGKSEGTENFIYASKVTAALPAPAMDVNKNVASVYNPPHLNSSLSDYSIQDYAQAYDENANTGVVTELLLNDNNYNVATARTTTNIMNISDTINTSDKNSQDQNQKRQTSSPENVPVLPSKPLSTNNLEKALMMTTTSYVQVEQSTNTPSFVEVTTKIIRTEATDKNRQFKTEKTVLTTGESSTAKSIASSTNSHINISSESAFDCQSRPTGKYADSKDCSKFYLCSGTTQTVVGSCPVNTVFSDIRKQCTRNLSHCIRNNEFKCSSAGRYADYLKPNVYYICIKKEQNFLRYKLQCQKGYLLKKITVTCYKNSKPSSQFISNDNSSSTTEKISQEKETVKKTSKENTNDFECEEEGKFADPNNCRGYYVCKLKNKSDESSKCKYKKCDEDEIFHKEKRKCVDAGSYECSYCDSLSPNIYYVRVKTGHHILTYKLQCQNSFYLNKVTVRCEKKSEPSNQSESSDISTSTNENKSHAARNKSKRSKNRKRFECQEEGKFADPNDCSKYYLCKEKNGSERSEQKFRRKHKRCNRHEVFLEEKKACVYSRNNKCIFDRRD